MAALPLFQEHSEGLQQQPRDMSQAGDAGSRGAVQRKTPFLSRGSGRPGVIIPATALGSSGGALLSGRRRLIETKQRQEGEGRRGKPNQSALSPVLGQRVKGASPAPGMRVGKMPTSHPTWQRGTCQPMPGSLMFKGVKDPLFKL